MVDQANLHANGKVSRYVTLLDSGGNVLSAGQRSATATVTAVNDQATTTTILASNANRVGASIFNDSTSILYLKFGTTASATDFTVKMAAGDYYEVPSCYTGRIDGIWSTDASGAARVTEVA